MAQNHTPTYTEDSLRQIIETGCRRGGETPTSRLNGRLDPRFVSCSVEEKTSVIAWPIREWQLNPSGDLHGGMIASMFDTSMGITAHWIAGDRRSTTVDLMTNYISAVPAGDELIIHSKIQKAGRSLIRVTAEAYLGSSGKLAATGTANFMVLG